jgi:hypothetical protein
MAKYGRKLKDKDDVMILRETIRPRDISDCVGKWILLNYRDDEGLVEEVEASKNFLVVLFGDVEEAEEYEIPFHSSEIIMWYKMSSKEQQERDEKAARVIQRAARHALLQHHGKGGSSFPINRYLIPSSPSRHSALTSKTKRLLTTSRTSEYQKCIKPKLKFAKGYYVESPQVPHSKGMVESLDLSQSHIQVVYNTSDGILYEKGFSYSDDDLVWYKKKQDIDDLDSAAALLERTEAGEDDVSAAATKIQSNYRGR